MKIELNSNRQVIILRTETITDNFQLGRISERLKIKTDYCTDATKTEQRELEIPAKSLVEILIATNH